MIKCMSKHFDKLQVLSITHNKIGVQGVITVAECLPKLKQLTTLDLSHDEIGDQGICELVKELDNCNLNLMELDLSGNCIGKNFTFFSKYCEILIHYLAGSSI